MPPVTLDNVDDVFTYHPPTTDFVKEKYHRLREGAKRLGRAILGPVDCPRTDSGDPQAGWEGWTSRDQWISKHAKAMLDLVQAELGVCDDKVRAIHSLGLLVAVLPTDRAATTGEQQRALECLRVALMWANASVALQGKI